MPVITINNVPESLFAILRARADAEQIGVGRALLRVAEVALTGETPPPVVTAATAPPTLAEATEVILEHVRPEQAQLIRDCAHETGLPVSQYVLTYIQLADERGETARMVAPIPGEGASAPAPAVLTAVPCKHCGTVFTPARPGAQFCPDPEDGTESCGRAWSLANLIRPRRPATMAAAGRLFAPPTSAPAAKAAASELDDLRRQMAELRHRLMTAPRESLVPEG